MKDNCMISDSLSRYALTVIRVALGIIFLIHGSHKVFGWPHAAGLDQGGLAATVQGMSALGLPKGLVYVISFTEFLGGAALIFGFLTRIASLGLLLVMVGAVVFVHWPNGFFINWFLKPGVGHGYEYNLALIAMSLSLIFGGAGASAIDNLFCQKKQGLE